MDGNAVGQARGVSDELLAFDRMRRVAEAGTIRVICELASLYNLQEAELAEALLERRIRPGGEGTPTVSEFLSLELAGLLRCTTTAAAGRIADALNLQYRHPRLFQAVQDLRRRPRPQGGQALRAPAPGPGRRGDHRMAAPAGRGWQAAFNALDKLIIASDTELAAQQERKAREDRGVSIWGAYEGVMNLTGRLDVTDARLVDDRLSWFADLIGGDFPTLTHAQLRAKAMGVLTDPYYAVALVEAHGQAGLPLRHRCCGCHPANADPAWKEAGQAGAPPTAPQTSVSPTEVMEAYLEKLASSPPPPRWPLASIRAGRADPPSHPASESPGKARARIDGRTLSSPAKHRPTLVLNIHINTDALGDSTEVARVEGAGHITTRLLTELIAEIPGVNLKVQPVIDLPNLAPADAYVPSDVMRRASILAFPHEPFPFSNRCSAGLDLDHTIAYRPGLRGQTRIGNLAPFTRRVHRAKTAGWWVVEQPTPGQVRWTSPLGYHYVVTPSGTLAPG